MSPRKGDPIGTVTAADIAVTAACAAPAYRGADSRGPALPRFRRG